MKEYYFLFFLALLWTGFAAVYDLKKREVPNWISFSLIAFGLANRAFYALLESDEKFFIFGLSGFGIFYLLAMGLYYGRVFAGGDAKLLMGFGVLMPAFDIRSLLLYSSGFLILLLSVGAVWSLVFSLYLVLQNKKGFADAFRKKWSRARYIVFLGAFAGAVLSIFSLYIPVYSRLLSFILGILLIGVPLLYVYLRALEQGCMIKLVHARELCEGDWLEKNVHIGNKTICKSVHGLSADEIKIIRRANKKVWIKEGIPFVPAFFFTLIIMGFFLANGADVFPSLLNFLYG